MDTDWMTQGKCRDMTPGLFFPSDGVGVQVAQRVCAECTVQSGVPAIRPGAPGRRRRLGGTSERQRRRLLKGHRPATVGADDLGRLAPAGQS